MRVQINVSAQCAHSLVYAWSTQSNEIIKFYVSTINLFNFNNNDNQIHLQRVSVNVSAALNRV